MILLTLNNSTNVKSAHTQTPVGVMMKLSEKQSYHCLLESVEGGDVRGRFSVVALRPDLIWQSKKEKVFINFAMNSSWVSF